ncbi:hypothetical protein ACRQFN_02220 [Actinotignum sp. GS-2025e]|uniref:hypothetical protein n=1 Tax=unclassified Actinotignum TaxID=2632702 RepID=UPI003F48547A
MDKENPMLPYAIRELLDETREMESCVRYGLIDIAMYTDDSDFPSGRGVSACNNYLADVRKYYDRLGHRISALETAFAKFTDGMRRK